MVFGNGVKNIQVAAYNGARTVPVSTIRKTTINYRIVASASPSRFEAHVGLYRLLMKGIFEPYVLTF
jgi:hypothetical protein